MRKFLKYKISGIIISIQLIEIEENLTNLQKKKQGYQVNLWRKNLSTSLIKKFYKETKGKVQIIGVGGVDSGQAALKKFVQGLMQFQLYTGMVYKGPGVVKQMKKT